ncbi:hypothetical protein NLC35_02325 [Candidatus Aminicenantes bacterium AC-334-K16]|nr:hypothetical protein [Candidatus Aminicenantes bacterium AC-334-K16]
MTPEILSALLKFLKDSFDDYYLLREIPQVKSQVQSLKFILRHDVQKDLNQALALARQEQELGLRGSFLVDINSPELGESPDEVKRTLQQINALGHEVGLLLPSIQHLSPQTTVEKFYEQQVLDLARHLEKIVTSPVFSVAFPEESFIYPENSYFLTRKICASSALLTRWVISDRERGIPLEALQQELQHPPDKILQVILHPELWLD